MTTEWAGVVWTEAQQVSALLGWPSDPDDRTTPAEFLDALRGCERLTDAVRFLAMALPRYESVMWAARIVDDQGDRPDATVMRSVFDWLHDPSDAKRRAAHAAARVQTSATPERMCAMAAFMSGGSVAPEDQPCQPPPRDAAGRFAAIAVIGATSTAPQAPTAAMSAATVHARRQAALNQALDAGERIARRTETVR